MYSVLDYSAMLRDGVRIDAYARALASLVTSRSVVVDIGAGTGIAALLAARMGARVVHAIDTNPAVHLLSDLARENGLGSQIRVHAASSLDVELPERADVIVSDLRGSFPLSGPHLQILRDARARFLAPDGVMLPSHDDLFVAGVESFELARLLANAKTSFERYGLRAEAAHASVLNTVHRDAALATISANDALTGAQRWGTVDYQKPTGGNIEADVELVVGRTGTMHALAIWFRATLFADITYENAPGTTMAYARTVLPLAEPLQLKHGARVGVTLRVDDHGESWAWETRATTNDGTARHLRQATFLGMPTSAEQLLRTAPSYAPRCSPEGEVASFVLQKLDGTTTGRAIEEQTAARFPQRDRDGVARVVRDLLKRYSG